MMLYHVYYVSVLDCIMCSADCIIVITLYNNISQYTISSWCNIHLAHSWMLAIWSDGFVNWAYARRT